MAFSNIFQNYLNNTTNNSQTTSDNNTGYVSGNRGSDLWSTGNKLKDIASGLVIGTANSLGNNKKGYYIPTAQYRGNGLANTNLNYISNDNYQNPYDQANLLTSILYNRKGQNQNGSSNNTGFKFSDVLGKLGQLAYKWNSRNNQVDETLGGFDTNDYGYTIG